VATDDADPRADIQATALVRAEPEVVFDFLSDLRNHWLLASRFVGVVTLDAADGGPANGGTVRIRGPLGTRRTARTRVIAAKPYRLMIGTAELAGGTRARVSWTLAGRLGSTRVRLAAEIERAGRLDRVLLALGGRWWLRRGFESTLRALGSQVGGAGGGGADAERSPEAVAHGEQ
jgi:hypothetical protein